MIHWNITLMHEVCFVIFALGVTLVPALAFAFISWAVQLGRVLKAVRSLVAAQITNH